MRFQIPSQASLHGIVQTHRSLASRAALLLRALREIKSCLEFASRKNSGQARLAGIAGFLTRHLQACLRGDLQKSLSIRAANLLRDFSAIRVNPWNPWLKKFVITFTRDAGRLRRFLALLRRDQMWLGGGGDGGG